MVLGQTPTGVSAVIEDAPGIGKTFLVRNILDSVAPGDAKILHVAGEQGRRNDPFAVAGQLLAGLSNSRKPGQASALRSCASPVPGAGQVESRATGLAGSGFHWLPYSSWRLHHGPVSLRPSGARSSHGYMPQMASTPRSYAE